MTTLTMAAINAAQVGQSLRDGVVPGLHVRVFASKRVFYLYYRTKLGLQRCPKIGDTRILSVAAAREIAREMLAVVARGGDPMADRETARQQPTVADLADKYWLLHGSQLKSRRDVKRHLDRYILPLLGKKRVADIMYSDAEKLHASIKSPVQATRCLATFSGMLKHAERWQMRPLGSNPCRLVKRAPEHARRRYLTAEEAPALLKALESRRIDAPYSVAFILMLLFSGARRGEIAAARWEWLEGSVLRLPDSKTGPRTIHLPQDVRDILATLPKTTGKIMPISNPDKIWRAVRKEAGCPDLRMHDLRRTFASVALSAGVSLSRIGELLGHRSSQVTKVYARLLSGTGDADAAATAVAMNNLLGRTPEGAPL